LIHYPQIGGFPLGMNNIQKLEAVPEGAVRSCVNWDIDDTGNLVRRRGYAKVYSGTIAKETAWSDGNTALFVENGDLKKLHSDYTAETVRAGVGNTPMAYLRKDGFIYFTNGTVTGKYTEKGGAVPWGINGPSIQPRLQALNSGELDAGTYQVAVTFVSPEGEESGTGIAATIEVPEAGAILAHDIQQPDSDQSINLYVSAVDGEELFLIASLRYGEDEYRINRVKNVTTRKLVTQFGYPPPAGNIIEYHNGRIYIADGKVLWPTRPMRYGLHMPATDFFLFGEDIAIVKSVDDGIYVATKQEQTESGTKPGRTYWLGNLDSGNLHQREILPYGAVPRTDINLPKTSEGARQVAWFSERGIVVGTAGGITANLMEDRVAVSKYSRGTMLFREQSGERQMVAVLQGASRNAYAASDYTDL
jgi:hypothetical protein